MDRVSLMGHSWNFLRTSATRAQLAVDPKIPPVVQSFLLACPASSFQETKLHCLTYLQDQEDYRTHCLAEIACEECPLVRDRKMRELDRDLKLEMMKLVNSLAVELLCSPGTITNPLMRQIYAANVKEGLFATAVLEERKRQRLEQNTFKESSTSSTAESSPECESSSSDSEDTVSISSQCSDSSHKPSPIVKKTVTFGNLEARPRTPVAGQLLESVKRSDGPPSVPRARISNMPSSPMTTSAVIPETPSESSTLNTPVPHPPTEIALSTTGSGVTLELESPDRLECGVCGRPMTFTLRTQPSGGTATLDSRLSYLKNSDLTKLNSSASI